MTLAMVANARRSCPEEYRELRRRDLDDSSSDSSEDRWQESVCDQAMAIAGRQSHVNEFNRAVLRRYCADYDQVLDLAREKNDTLCENKKRELKKKKKRDTDSDESDSDDDDNDNDDDKRRGLHKRQLKKRVALRFIRKRLS